MPAPASGDSPEESSKIKEGTPTGDVKATDATAGVEANGSREEEASKVNGEDSHNDEEDDEDEDEDEGEDEERMIVQPITDSREIALRIKDMNEHLVCTLCDGYFREAHTIMECLHTFCKVCLYDYLLTRDDRVGTQRKSDCPTCHTLLINAEPMKNHVRFDRTKQNIVDLIVPHFKEDYANEKNRASASRKTSARPTAEAPPPKKMRTEGQKAPKLYLTYELRPNPEKKPGERKELKALVKPWLRTSPKLTVKHLKKYLAMKLELDNFEEVELTCQGEVLGTDHTLEFIKKTRWHGKSNLKLHYRWKCR